MMDHMMDQSSEHGSVEHGWTMLAITAVETCIFLCDVYIYIGSAWWSSIRLNWFTTATVGREKRSRENKQAMKHTR